MKKIISIMLAALMLFSVTFVASATPYIDEESGHAKVGPCSCIGHFDEGEEDGFCNCCLYCTNKKEGYITSCVKYNAEADLYEVCCKDCSGIWPCDCGCACCAEHDENYEDQNNSNLGDVWGEEEQEEFVSAFQALLKKLSDAFDKFFDAIFEFLRLDEVLGTTN